jgi:hypothetical protein
MGALSFSNSYLIAGLGSPTSGGVAIKADFE